MQSLETTLYNYMVQNGVDSGTAFSAAQNCARTVRNSAGAGFVLGVTAGVATMNPSALLMGGVGAFGGGAMALAISPSCHEVRAAAGQWADSALSF